MTGKQPPSWLERILLGVLPERSRQSVSGDLLEEFDDQVRVRGSRLGASIWYARQILSFVPGWLGSQAALRPLLLSLCSFTALSGLWLGAMGLRLKHPGYVEGEVISGIIVTEALLTIAALRFRRISTLHHLSAIGCLPLLWLADKALKGIIDGSNFEGYVLLIALALVFQVIFTFAMLIAERNRPQISI
jgi:hypothetical protein